MGIGQVLWAPAKSGSLPFSFCPPLLLKKGLPLTGNHVRDGPLGLSMVFTVTMGLVDL